MHFPFLSIINSNRVPTICVMEAFRSMRVVRRIAGGGPGRLLGRTCRHPSGVMFTVSFSVFLVSPSSVSPHISMRVLMTFFRRSNLYNC
jgi:hypothetical protein